MDIIRRSGKKRKERKKERKKEKKSDLVSVSAFFYEVIPSYSKNFLFSLIDIKALFAKILDDLTIWGWDLRVIYYIFVEVILKLYIVYLKLFEEFSLFYFFLIDVKALRIFFAKILDNRSMIQQFEDESCGSIIYL